MFELKTAGKKDRQADRFQKDKFMEHKKVVVFNLLNLRQSSIQTNTQDKTVRLTDKQTGR